MILSQKEVSFRVISDLRSQGKSDSQILMEGPGILLEMFRRGEWEKKSGGNSESEVLRYSKDLLKNWMKKDVRLNGGEKYVPSNPRGPRDQSSGSPDLRKVLEFLRSNDPESPLIQELEEKIMWEEVKKVG